MSCTIKDINHAKATGLKERLESINSHVRVEIVNEYLSYNNLDALTMCDVIIDCTAKDNPLFFLLSNLRMLLLHLSCSSILKIFSMAFPSGCS